MKALVLTFDKNRAITEHMIFKYNQIWPDHPFVFRVPYQENKQISVPGQVEYKKSSPDIKSTLLSLIEDLPDEEWIYWCIDDKYPVKMDIQKVKELLTFVQKNQPAEISGFLFCRRSVIWKENYLTGGMMVDDFDNKYLEKTDYRNIWIHQFLKVKVLRFMFQSFPDDIHTARLMDEFIRAIKKPADHQIFISEKNRAIFEESTSQGYITLNCYESMLENGLPLPEWVTKAPEVVRRMGHSSAEYWEAIQKQKFRKLKAKIKKALSKIV